METVQRATWRTQVTKLCNSAGELMKTITSEPSENVEIDLSVLAERIKNAHINLKKADEAIPSTLSKEEVAKELEGVLEYDDRAVGTMAKLQYHLKRLQRGLNQESGKSLTVEGVKLKAIELKKFDGKHENWLPFWEQFKCTVHENMRLSVASKFNFLSEALVGRAAATIAGFAPTERCYNEAILLLEEEFGNTEKIVEKFVQRLLHIKTVPSGDVKGLRQLYSEVNGTIRSLTALDVKPAQYEIMVKSILLKAIPPNLRVQFHREEGKANHSSMLHSSRATVIDKTENEEQLKSLLEFIRIELEALEKSQLSSKEKEEERPRRDRPSHGTATSLFTNTTEKQCMFCKRTNHTTPNCKSNVSLEQKKLALKKEARCYRCTNKNHTSKFCRAQWLKCEFCGGRHCTAMCERRNDEKREYLKSERKGEEAEQRTKATSSSTATALNTVEERAAGIYLQTAKAIIQNKTNSKRVLSRIVMDNGSQRSFITEKIVTQLNLVSTGVEKLNVAAFGKNKEKRSREYQTGRGAGSESHESSVLCATQDQAVSFDLCKFWILESIGIVNSEDLSEKVCTDIEHIDGRYSVKLPWRIDGNQLHDNKRLALHRLKTLTSKLQRNEKMLTEYDEGIRELLGQGIAERVCEVAVEHPTYYMPHRPVYRDDKETTRMRIVFDASSSEQGCASLNELLSPGDDMVADLFASLIRFRSNKIAITADIEKAFLQISLAANDRDSHRFFWYAEQPRLSENLPTIEEFRMTRVTFGVTSSPFLLASTLKNHFDLCKPKYGSICDELQKSFYVDDLIMSKATSEAAKQIQQQATIMLREANFNLRKWNTNNASLREHFGKEATMKQKVLGLGWSTVSDQIYIDIASVSAYILSLRATKRNVLKAMAKIFDPLGLLGPFTVRIKLLLQDIWREQIDWDKSLDGDLKTSFENWQEEMQVLKEFEIGRCLSHCSDTVKELHIFADASPKAYGAVAYVREMSSDGVTTNLICSKNRVSPIAKTTQNSELSLPRLELTAALMAARLKRFLVDSLDFHVSAVYLWSDSTIALNWIAGGGSKIKPYVKARVSEISDLTNIYDWRHCRGKTNPADLLTRGVKADILVESELWKRGPPWLMDNELGEAGVWCADIFNLLTPTTMAPFEHAQAVSAIMPLENFSRLKRLLRTTAYVFRFSRNLRAAGRRKGRKIQPISAVTELTAHELREAEEYWIKQVQRSEYNREITALSKNETIPTDSKIISLNPMLVDDVLRLSGRLPSEQYGCISNPIILPKASHFCLLLVRQAHEATMHGGINMVLAEVRNRFWIVRGRQLIKNILQHCVICKRLYGKGASEPWTILPTERVVTARPFETVGIDFTGPLYIESGDPSEQRKVYIMLFTCAAIRAVHLELVKDMTVASCVAALRRFIARRGTPAIIMSDNAKTFKRADVELRKLEELLKQKDVQHLAAGKGINWKFIPERAAWWGGFWERLVRTIKNCLKAAIGKTILNYDELSTYLAEVESVTNQRPLTYISSDPTDLEPLTPGHFINGGEGTLLQNQFGDDGTTLAQSWQRRQALLKRYVQRWRTEYLAQLRSIHHNKTIHAKSVKIGDVVIVHDDNKARLLWKLAVIVATYTGRDGRVRACDIKVKDGKILKRPVQLLYPLEVSSAMAGPEDVENI